MNEQITRFRIRPNECLKHTITGYYNSNYYRKGEPENPDFLWQIKNEYLSFTDSEVEGFKDQLIETFLNDLPQIMQLENITSCVCVSVPRAKSQSYYKPSQLQFKEGIRAVSQQVAGVEEAVDTICRTVDTYTTHRKQDDSIPNEGEKPYPGITVDTCTINSSVIANKTVILVDDIYTPDANIDEDCIQAMLDNGASKVIFYAIGKTYYENEFEGAAQRSYQILAARELGLIKDNYDFWYNYSTTAKFDKMVKANPQVKEVAAMLQCEFESHSYGVSCIISSFDELFIKTDYEKTEMSVRPYLFMCRGNVNLLNQTDKNVAVFGVNEPTDEIISRMEQQVKNLIDNGSVCVTGLSNKGCINLALNTCIDNGGKVIAVSAYPLRIQHSELENKIVENDGLIISEYIDRHPEANQGQRYIFIEKVKVTISSKVYLACSYLDKELGDNYPKLGIDEAQHQEKPISVMYKAEIDAGKPELGLNEELVKSGRAASLE